MAKITIENIQREKECGCEKCSFRGICCLDYPDWCVRLNNNESVFMKSTKF